MRARIAFSLGYLLVMFFMGILTSLNLGWWILQIGGLLIILLIWWIISKVIEF